MSAREPRWRRLAAAMAAAALTAVAGCGIDGDSDPTAIAAENLPSGLVEEPTTTSTTESAATVQVTVYFLARTGDNNVLTASTREVGAPAGPPERLRALLTQPPLQEEQDRGITTAIPSDTALLDTAIDTDRQLLTIDLSRHLFEIQGAGLRTAFGQLVWTATEDARVERVQFLVDGEPATALTGDGEEKTEPVSRADYSNLRPS